MFFWNYLTTSILLYRLKNDEDPCNDRKLVWVTGQDLRNKHHH